MPFLLLFFLFKVKCYKSIIIGEFFEVPVVRAPCFHCLGSGFNPWSRTTSHMIESLKKKKRLIIKFSNLLLHLFSSLLSFPIGKYCRLQLFLLLHILKCYAYITVSWLINFKYHLLVSCNGRKLALLYSISLLLFFSKKLYHNF